MSSELMDGPVTLELGLDIVHNDYICRVINYLDTKALEQSHKNYIKCYSMVLRLCDELDKAKDLNEYYKKTLNEHISNSIMPNLNKLKEEALLKEFVRQWQNYTILVHFMRKMFNYLDRYYLKNSNMQSLAMSALVFFKEKCFSQLTDRLTAAILN